MYQSENINISIQVYKNKVYTFGNYKYINF